MSNTISDTGKQILETAREGAERAGETTNRALGSVEDGAERAVEKVRTKWWDGVKAVASVVTMMRGLQANDALRWVGLERRRSPLVSWGMFGAGVAVGAGIGVLLAPASGAETRRRITTGISGLAGRLGAAASDDDSAAAPSKKNSSADDANPQEHDIVGSLFDTSS